MKLDDRDDDFVRADLVLDTGNGSDSSPRDRGNHANRQREK